MKSAMKVIFLGLWLGTSVFEMFAMKENINQINGNNGEEQPAEFYDAREVLYEVSIPQGLEAFVATEQAFVQFIKSKITPAKFYTTKKSRYDYVLSHKFEGGNTLLHIAAFKNYSEALGAILNDMKFYPSDHPLNQKNDEGKTPWHIAKEEKFLKEAARLYLKTLRVWGGLRSARERDLLDALLTKDHDGNTPLHLAAEKGENEKDVENLIDAIISLVKSDQHKLELLLAENNNSETPEGLASSKSLTIKESQKNRQFLNKLEEPEESSGDDIFYKASELLKSYKNDILPKVNTQKSRKLMYAGAGIAGVGLTAYGIYKLARNPEVQKLYQQALRSGSFKNIQSFIKAGFSFMGTAYIKSSRNVRDYVNALRKFVEQRGREVVAKATKKMENLITSLNWQTSPSDAARVMGESTDTAVEAIKAANPEGVTQITDKFLEAITSAVESIKHPNPDEAVVLMNEARQVLENAENSLASLPVGSSSYDVSTRSEIIDTILDAANKLYTILQSVFGEEVTHEFYVSRLKNRGL